MTEVGDFNRFKTAEKFAGYIGLTPGEKSSGESERKTTITKAGNRHLRRLAVECSWNYSRGIPGRKSDELKKRQQDMLAEVVSYADRASVRCQRKYYRMTVTGKNANKTVAALA